jgi:hypothetical protein
VGQGANGSEEEGEVRRLGLHAHANLIAGDLLRKNRVSARENATNELLSSAAVVIGFRARCESYYPGSLAR